MMCANLAELGTELARLDQAGIDSFHFDIMDGHFVPNLALSPAILAGLRPLTKRPFVAHLMVSNPGAYVEALAGVGADACIFHVEACPYPRRMMRAIAESGMVPGVAISPATSVAALQSIADIAFVLVMTVEPGFAGADWIAGSPGRVRDIRQLCGSHTAIAVDGHVSLATAPVLRGEGADMFACGSSSIFAKDHTVDSYRSAVDALRNRLQTAAKDDRR
jgi:ribulose-phosphate 3-epimerase